MTVSIEELYRILPLSACVVSVPLLSFPVVDDTEYSDFDCPSESSELITKKTKNGKSLFQGKDGDLNYVKYPDKE